MSAHEPTVGIIGLGTVVPTSLRSRPAAARSSRSAQRDEAAAKTIASRYGVPGVFASWEAMLDRARPEIVVIATPPHLHHAIALRAFAGGAHVLCEKPLPRRGAVDEGRRRARAASA